MQGILEVVGGNAICGPGGMLCARVSSDGLALSLSLADGGEPSLFEADRTAGFMEFVRTMDVFSEHFDADGDERNFGPCRCRALETGGVVVLSFGLRWKRYGLSVLSQFAVAERAVFALAKTEAARRLAFGGGWKKLMPCPALIGGPWIVLRDRKGGWLLPLLYDENDRIDRDFPEWRMPTPVEDYAAFLARWSDRLGVRRTGDFALGDGSEMLYVPPPDGVPPTVYAAFASQTGKLCGGTFIMASTIPVEAEKQEV